ncbi:MAG: iron ABC transporter substrate-binding protein [Anaerolineales bacterium]|nr:iron ABC transporter substrate-binding protein [Anaerolineales bacterium]
MRTKLFWLGLLTAVLFIATACQPTPAVDNEDSAVEGAPSASTETSEQNRLVIYSGRSESLVAPIIEQFSAETGIEVEVRYGNTAELAATLLEEGENSPADLFYAQDPGGLGALADQGLFAPVPAEILGRVPERFQASDGNWIGISGRARVIAYNTDNVTEADLPQNLQDLTDPKWQGRIGWAPTNGSFQAMLTGMRTIWGEEATRAWLEGIIANDPVVYPNNTSIVEGLGKAEIDVGLVNHYYLFRFLAEEGDAFPVRNYFLPAGDPGSLIMVSGAGILNTADNPGSAAAFLDYMTTAEAQQYFANETYEYPLVEGVSTSDQLTPLAELDAIAVDIPLSAMADLAGTAALLSELGLLE